MGIFGIYLFLAVIGAFCELSALTSIGELAVSLFIFAFVLVTIHGLFIFCVGIFFQHIRFISKSKNTSVTLGEHFEQIIQTYFSLNMAKSLRYK